MLKRMDEGGRKCGLMNEGLEAGSRVHCVLRAPYSCVLWPAGVGNLLFADLVSHALGGCYPGIRPILPIRQKSRSILLKSVATILLNFFRFAVSEAESAGARSKTCKSVQPRVQKEQLFWPSSGPCIDEIAISRIRHNLIQIVGPRNSNELCPSMPSFHLAAGRDRAFGGFCLDGTGIVLTEISRR